VAFKIGQCITNACINITFFMKRAAVSDSSKIRLCTFLPVVFSCVGDRSCDGRHLKLAYKIFNW
jgi:hypothetical protein